MTKRKLARKLSQFETLESRHLMATFGVPWPDTRNLSVSFPTDQAAIGAYRNVARESLDQVTDRLQWQESVLRAFQTWSVQANLNIGLVPDRGDDFGAVGLSTNDPRFGEFRVGAFPQQAVLANALPFQVTAGTWSGDVLVNSDINYFLADWNSSGPIQVPAPNENGPAVELFSVLLHEAGNALGLADNNVLGAVMNGNYSGPNGSLKPTDIQSIRALYGTRRDIYEPRANGTLGTATPIAYSAGYNGSEPVSVRGSLNTMSDVDVYRFRPLAGQEKVTVRLWASGISLVKANLEVLDRNGVKIADAKADSIFQNNLQLEIGSLKDHRDLFIRVTRNADDVFGIGDYRIDLDYRDSSLQPSIIAPNHDQDAEDESNELVDYVSVDALFSQVGLIDREIGQNDTLTTAVPLATTTGFLANTRYELQSTLASATDRDLWSFRAPNSNSPVLQITVDPVGLQNPTLDVVLLNRLGDRVESKLLAKPDGGVTIEVLNPVANQEYVLFVRTAAGSAVTSGNYVASMSFATNPANSIRNVYQTSVSHNSEDISQLTTYKTQLMRFDLLALSANVDLGIQLSIYDARTGDIVASMASANGRLRTDYIWLGAGEYYLRATGRTRLSGATGTVLMTLAADVLSDDQGPRAVNPGDPVTPPPDWNWQDYTPSVPPLAIESVEPPFLNPWAAPSNNSFIGNYYNRFLR